jgi:hypothetical protein
MTVLSDDFFTIFDEFCPETQKSLRNAIFPRLSRVSKRFSYLFI